VTCRLCGRSGPDVRTGLACYADDGRFERIERCVDHQSCRTATEAAGREWPLIDITTPTRRREARS
jgi:hypothetical protein